MSLTQLKEQAAHLPSPEQQELIAFLVAQQTTLDGGLQRELAQKIDDNNPDHWVELDELLKRYSE